MIAAIPAPEPAVGITSPSPTIAFVAIDTAPAGAGEILGSFDAGTTWRPVYRESTDEGPIELVGFTTPSQGVALTDTGELLITRNGGQSWTVQSSS
jgi:photosystem II stability/assembly factor-like uncharacterized protein